MIRVLWFYEKKTVDGVVQIPAGEISRRIDRDFETDLELHFE
jgi:hypothetical protein